MKFQEFKKAVNKPFFTKLDLDFLGISVYASQLSLWVKKGQLTLPRRGLFVFTDEQHRLSGQDFVSPLYEPSYLSMEYALGHFGFIPEMVFSFTAITTRTTRTISTEFGTFSYRHIHPKLFFGYTPKETAVGKYLLAEPEKALLDYLYFNTGTIHSKDDIDALRFNGDELNRRIDRKKLAAYQSEFGISKLDRILREIFKNA